MLMQACLTTSKGSSQFNRVGSHSPWQHCPKQCDKGSVQSTVKPSQCMICHTIVQITITGTFACAGICSQHSHQTHNGK